jgi:hypothetical protein
MAGKEPARPHWIPWCKGLARKPEVLLIAARTGMNRLEVAASLMEFWEWCDSVTPDGKLPGFSVALLSSICPDVVPQFFDALVFVGWLTVVNEGLEIPNYAVWMGRNAKQRLLNTRRKQDSRQNPTPCRASVALLSPDCPESVALPARGTVRGTERDTSNTKPPSHPPTGEASASKVKAILSQHQAERFARFWTAYPRKTGRGAAERWWDRHKPDDALLGLILQAVEAHKTCETWRRGFVPHPTTWLNQRRWQDEPASAQPAPAQPRDARAIMDAARARMDMLIAGPQPSPETRSDP